VFAATAANDKDFHSDRLDCRDSRAGREKLLDFRTTVIARGQVMRLVEPTIAIFRYAE
jgi:hypothetical protein